MSNILFRSNNDVVKDNYRVISLLTLFIIFKIFYTGIYSFINGNGNLYLIFKSLIIYFIYYFILIIFNRKNDNYYLISSLIISFIIPINTPLHLFIVCSFIGNIISYIIKNKINSVVITSLLISLFLSNNYMMDSYTGIFYYIYLGQCTISFIYLYFNKLVKIRVLLLSLISMMIINIINNIYIFDISLFCILFIVSDNRYSPLTKYGEVIGGIIFGIFIYILGFVFNINYYLYLSIFLYEGISFIFNYFSVKFYDKKIFKLLFSN